MRLGNIDISFPAFGVFLFFVIPVFIAHSVFGGIFTAILGAMFLFLLVSIGHLFLTHSQLRVLQKFSQTHPKKGQTISFDLDLGMESFLPTCRVEWEYDFQRPDWGNRRESRAMWLRPKENIKEIKELDCPFRGTYTMGLENLILEDVLGWVKLYPKVWKKTFYVFPRLVVLEPNRWVPGWETQTTVGSKATLEDPMVFESLRDYQQGESLRHMDWKKFAASGRPVVRKFEPESFDGIQIFMDLDRGEEVSAQVLMREDLTVESTLALVKYFLDNRTNMEIRGKTYDRDFFFHGSSPGVFETFWKRTEDIKFGAGPTVAMAYPERLQAIRGKVIIVTHRLDGSLVDLVKMLPGGLFLINNAGLSPEEVSLRNKQVADLRRGGSKILMFGNLGEFQEEWKWLSS